MVNASYSSKILKAIVPLEHSRFPGFCSMEREELIWINDSEFLVLNMPTLVITVLLSFYFY